jgi:hypothetical protein
MDLSLAVLGDVGCQDAYFYDDRAVKRFQANGSS